MTLPQETMQARFHAFLHRFWTISRAKPGIRYIREIDSMIPRIFRPDALTCSNEQVSPLAMLNVDCNGNVSSFSPELLGYENERYNNFIVGNVHQHTLQQMLDSTTMKAMVTDIQAGVDACRNECGYFSLCGGGAPVNKLSENGAFNSTKTSFCNLIQITPTNLILNALNQMEDALANTKRRAMRPLHAANQAPIQISEHAHVNHLRLMHSPSRNEEDTNATCSTTYRDS
jgi:uncharacterized protein